MHQIRVVDNDITNRNFHAAVLQPRRIYAGKKADYLATWPDCTDPDARQTFMCTLHPELVKANLRQLCTKFASCGWKQFQIRCRDRPLIGKRVRKRKHLAPSHDLSLNLLGWTISSTRYR